VLVCGTFTVGQDYTLTAIPQFDAYYPPGKWIPVRMEFRNRSDRAIEGWGVLPSRDDAGESHLRVPVHVPAQSRVRVFNYGYFPAQDPEVAQRAPFPALSIATWQRHDGGSIARTDILGRALAGDETVDGSTDAGALLLTVSGRKFFDDLPASNSSDFARMLRRVARRPYAVPTRSPEALPPHWIAYDSSAAIILDGLHPDQLDPTRRAALLDHVLAGGVLLLSGSEPQDDPTDSWLGPYLPVQIIGHRQMERIEPLDGFSGEPLALQHWVNVTEAVAGDGTVVLRDEHFIHAAYRRLGLGRIVFISFPINALDENDERTAAVWRQLLGMDEPPRDWRQTQLAQEHERVLESMVGLPSPRWSLAAAVVAGYLLLIGGIQFVLGGVNRPRAFTAAAVLAVVLTIGLIAGGAMQRRDVALTGAGLTILDFGPAGGGHQQAVYLWFGADDNDFSLAAADDGVVMRALEPGPAPPMVVTAPFGAANAGVHSGRIERLWAAEAVLEPDRHVLAVAQFGPNGPEISIDNHAFPLEAPLLVWQGRNIPIEDLPLGSTVLGRLSPPNPPLDYSSTGVFASERAKLRGDMLRASLTPRGEQWAMRTYQHPPLLAGWIADSAAPQLVQTIL
jgi:uncharacterized membrane protein YphA (DoxX/SURF4 family)